MRRKGESGQALVLVAAALGIFLLGAVGLAVDVGQLYAHRQMAQNAADAAAEAGILSMFNGSNTGTNAFGTGTYSCGSADQTTPCRYARMNSFSTASDTVLVEFPAGPDTLIRVTVSRAVPTTFMRLLGKNSGTVSASATACIANVLSPVPIVVLDPRGNGGGDDAFHINGGPTITITGGPNKSIQVNSRSDTAIQVKGNASLVDLSRAGPAGNGASFGNAGGPYPYPGRLQTGVGRYIAPSSPIGDPLANVSPPARPTTIGTKAPLAKGTSGCPAAANDCQLYQPGYWAGGIQVKNETAVFTPGIYYMGSKGFENAANGEMYMCVGCAGTTETGQGMLVYNTGGGTFQVNANAGARLLGTPMDSIYKGILFFNDRDAATATHKLGGGGELSLRGTIYITNTKLLMYGGTVQTVLLQGNPGNQTVIEGQIITSRLELGGNAGIQMLLSAAPVYTVAQVALIR